MRANNSNVTFISNVYQQEAGETNWNNYQVIMTGGASPLSLRGGASTATNLVVIDDVGSLTTGSKIYVSTNNGSTIETGTIGSVTTSNLNITTSTLTLGSSTSGTSVGTDTQGYGVPGKYNYDGTIFWTLNATNNTLLEYSITAGNASTIATTGKSMAWNIAAGFAFSSNGRFLYRMSTSESYTIERFTMSTPWDISTVIISSLQKKALITGNPNSNNVRNMIVSSDGTKIMLVNTRASSNIFVYTMSVPFDLDSISGNTFSYQTTLSCSTIDVSPDGLTWYLSDRADNYVSTLSVAVSTTAWDPRTIGASVVLTTPSSTANVPYQANSSWANHFIVSGNGKYCLLLPNNLSSAFYRFTSYTLATNKDFACSKNINISGLNLSAAPTHAWINNPTVSIGTATSSSLLSKTKIYLDLATSPAATTTTATVSSTETGLISVGSTVLLNESTPVTVTAVTETANGSAAQGIAGSADYLFWFNKSFNTGVTANSITISNDGFYMYVVGNKTISSSTSTLYQFGLSTAYDVTTAVLLNSIKLLNNTNFYNASYASGVFGCDVAPDGSSFIICTHNASVAYSIRQYKMYKKHNLDTAYYYSEVLYGAVIGGSNFARVKFNLTGTQIEIAHHWTNNGYMLYYAPLSTPYNLATVGGLVAAVSSGDYIGRNGGCWSADGLTYYVLNSNGNSGNTTINGFTASVAHNYSTISWLSVSNTGTATGFPVSSPVSAGSAPTSGWTSSSMFMSHNGLHFYMIRNDGLVYQFGVRTRVMTKYAITFASQASAPTSVYLPASTYTEQTLTPSFSSGNLVFTGTQTTTDARAIQFKLTNNMMNSDVSQIRINLERT